jgi:hypothetical protein
MEERKLERRSIATREVGDVAEEVLGGEAAGSGEGVEARGVGGGEDGEA